MEDEMSGACSTNGRDKKCYNMLVGKLEQKRPLGRPRRRWDDNIRMDLGETVWEDVDWFHLVQDRKKWLASVNTVTNFRVPHKVGNFLIIRVTISFSRRTLPHAVNSPSKTTCFTALHSHIQIFSVFETNC
jgi:hypothetical protein